jgi:hypothetical protein
MASFGLIGMAGGIGGEMVKQADEERKLGNEKDFATWRMNVLNELRIQEEGRAETRQINAEQRKIKNDDQVRKDQVGRIDAGVSKLADVEVGKKRGLVQAGIADPDSWSAEQQAAVDQSLSNDKTALVNDPKLRTKAAVSSGDISPKDAAVLDQRSEADLTRLMLGEQRDQTLRMIAAGHDDTRKLVAGMAAASKKDGAAKEDRVLVHQFLAQFDRKISGNQAEIRSLRGSLKNNYDDAEKASIQEQIKELESANKNLEAAQMQYAKDSGIKVPNVEKPAETPKPADASAIAKPLSQSEFDKIPKGGRYVNPKDGKTYIKN